LIFGSKIVVKKLIVKEIRDARIRQEINPERLDALLGLNADFPRIRELEANPGLFHPEILSEINWATGNDLNICCSSLTDRIIRFLDDPENLAQVTREWLSSNIQAHVTIWPETEEGRDELLAGAAEAVYSGRPINWPGGLNSVSAQQYGLMYMFLCIMDELKEVE